MIAQELPPPSKTEDNSLSLLVICYLKQWFVKSKMMLLGIHNQNMCL
jgi:hypothetical protein